jgi:hypothetical protein
MQTGSLRIERFILSVVLLLPVIALVFTGCGSSTERQQKKLTEMSADQLIDSGNSAAYTKFSSFQNADSTWGFTIFVNSRPYLLYKRIPFPDAVSGFPTRKDAEYVAGLFVKMIRNGDSKPELSTKVIDSLELIMKIRK